MLRDSTTTDNAYVYMLEELDTLISDNKIDISNPSFDHQELFIKNLSPLLPLETRIKAYQNISLKVNELRVERYKIQLNIHYQKLHRNERNNTNQNT